MRKLQFGTGEFYHIYNRGVDKRDIFLADADYRRFIESMYLFNDSNYIHQSDPINKMSLLSVSDMFAEDRNQFVSIISFTLMRNHYHMFVEQLIDNGISMFMQKLNKGYSRHFNIIYDRTGTLFEGNFEAKHINSDAYFQHIPVYIHLNVLDCLGKPWREGKLVFDDQTKLFLDSYKWSSHKMLIDGKQDFPVIDLDYLSNLYENDITKYRLALQDWSARSYDFP